MRISLDLIQISKQAALQKNHPSELSAFEKKGILQATVLFWQHFPLSWSTQSSLELQAAGEKEVFREIKKIHTKYLCLSKSITDFCNSMYQSTKPISTIF